MEWICANNSASWSARNQQTSVVFDNKTWLMGGSDAVSKFNDVWYSEDGVSWTQATASAQWSPRRGHTSVIYDNKMWVIGGTDSINDFNDVWYSTDGINWTQVTSSAQWSPRSGHASVVFDNKIWVMGGISNYHYLPDIWYSTDGANWTQATASAPWGIRGGHTLVVFDDKMWIIAGSYVDSGWWVTLGDIWYSTDGMNWTQLTQSFPWEPRFGHTSVVFDNKVWLMGGSVFHAYYNDVWYSNDCSNWIQANESAPWSARFGHSSVVLNNKLWVMGGLTESFKNDVWYSNGLGIEERQPHDAEPLMPEIYPNPAKSVMRVLCPLTAKTIKIFDVSGKLIKSVDKVTSAQGHKQELRISLKGINPGIYFLRIGTETKKFLVVR
jgi:leucine-zipper-like transcriptional regulator 1